MKANILLVALIFSQLLMSQDKPVAVELKPSIFQEWYTGTNQVHYWTIKTDYRRIVRKKLKEEYQPAVLEYYDKDSTLQSFELKLKARGNIRKEVCLNPPLMMKFKKAYLQDRGYRPSNKIKMVLECRDSKANEQYLFKEYLAYKLYNLISPYSFNAQLIHITFIDEKNKEKKLWGFLIEPERELATRTTSKNIKREKANQFILQKEPFRLMSGFQYMIGNTDWSVGNMHNLKLLKAPEFNKIIPVPYDFDYSGLVNANYAVPHESIPISVVRQRYYIGRKCEPEEALELAQFYQDKKEDIMQICADLANLESKTLTDIQKYLDDFFKKLENNKRVKAIFATN